MASDRTHLSIGEVLTLLQPEFPDITISKIRFLESQGLLDPERTPSGYRKFHDDDVERLRWILTQQRDHFLPLKVIKERLASGDLDGAAADGVLPLAAEGAASAALVGSSDAGAAVEGEEPPVARAPLTLLKRAGVVSDEDAHPAGPVSRAVASPGEDRERARVVAQLVEGPPPTEPEPDPEPDPGPSGRGRHPTGHPAGEPGAPPAPAAKDPVTLSLDDLSAATGLTARELGELERYGLLSARSMGSVDYYDEDALIVARLAVGFRRYGIEPRHLRMYKVAADREAGLFEQLITPLLKQRRPDARQEAVEMLEDLAELADDLRAAMVRSALRGYLGQV
ncbi:MAG: MerR family transcriptional regulator [Acidimicrobiales bacterium]|jgi:DNA-binding transcriptional MerR regulator|nr:MerR family transcriptional regulator [Acidimicrobiales bacterium]